MPKKKYLPDRYGKRFKKHIYGTLLSEAQMKCIPKEECEHEKAWDVCNRPYYSFEACVFYGIHVRGFTMDESSHCKYRGTFLGICEKLEYLKKLGITSLVLMPAYAFIERECMESDAQRQPLKTAVIRAQNNALNYWGFKKGFYYAPKAEYAAGENPCEEFRELVRSCHGIGIELFMQFYFTDDMGEAEIGKILRFWSQEYHVDGFQIVSEHPEAEWVKISEEAGNAKLILHNGAKYKCFRNFVQNKDNKIAVYDDAVLHAYRKFIRGDEFVLAGVMDAFGRKECHVAVLNRVADYDGFRLADLVSYDYKYNEANGEHNLDGSDYNFSWNCGAEGETLDSGILRLRRQQMRNFLCLLFLSRGMPYIFMGDEMAKTQKGNNNPYNQDNEISYINWEDAENNKDFVELVTKLIAFRKVLYESKKELSFHGVEVYRPIDRPYRRELGILLSGKYTEGVEEESIYLACNMHNTPHGFQLPRVEKEKVWCILYDTTDNGMNDCMKCNEKVIVAAHSITVLITKTKPDA